MHKIAQNATNGCTETGAATNLISGLGYGMMSPALPVIALVAAILVSYKCAGLYGIAIAMLYYYLVISIIFGVFFHVNH